MMKAIINLVLFFASLAYPIYWLWGESSQVLVLLPFIIGFFWGLKGIYEQTAMRYFSWGIAILLMIVGITRTDEMMYGYPIMINGLMLVIFGTSLWQKQTIIERFARMQTPNLSEKGVRYTRNVTLIWCGFFIFNIAISSITIYSNLLDYWALYNGFISYLLMGILMAGEWIVRQYMKKHYEK
ncbi:hypothetical protein BKG91_01240 [Rodentibacter caecimuris]|uniref:Uncharacterized protein n=1 Tax=Rodentibacter caecimuris TaxID=1796644 RepID=A0A9X8YYA1_9PAST|nr:MULTISPECIES: hypothetical protein [Pasteurellaceae]MCQ9123688.1 hypothetical protein [Rodentibacter heylii]MCR1837162.1 hypothetical protein [Pasteurella caecimuris]MCU0106828.1 hypothetical protein [Pasteurella caecimuris]MCX2961339.1 hypothetical protein [Rodentibacter heylii]OOF71426.1 hypothetical protein BKG90_08320 [Rodentibacter heylii]